MSDDPNMELDASERARIEHAAVLVREVLRATDVAGLDAAMRAQIAARAARRRPSRSWPLLLAYSVGGAAVVALTLFLTVVRPAQERAALAEQARVERVRAERLAEARRVEIEEARAAAERARAQYLAEQAARSRAKADCTTDDARGAASKKRVRSSAKPASRSSAGGGGGCDPDDPLCGL